MSSVELNKTNFEPLKIQMASQSRKKGSACKPDCSQVQVIEKMAPIFMEQIQKSFQDHQPKKFFSKVFAFLHYHLNKSQYVNILNQETILTIKIKNLVDYLNETIDKESEKLVRADIKEAFKGNQSKISKMQFAFAVRQSYERLIKNYEIKTQAKSSEAELISRSGDIHAKFTLKTIVKVINAFEQANAKMTEMVKIEKNTFVARKIEEGELDLCRYQLLGEGTSVQAIEIFSINSGKSIVLKKPLNLGKDLTNRSAKQTMDQQQKEIERAYQLLSEIHSKEQVIWGIQDKPYRLVKIDPKQLESSSEIFKLLDAQPSTLLNNEEFNGYLEKECGLDYESLMKQEENVSLHQVFFEFHQLLYGGNYLTNRDIIHLDLKGSNIFTTRDKEGRLLLHISDFGGARKNEHTGATTNGLFSKEDRDQVKIQQTFLFTLERMQKEAQDGIITKELLQKYLKEAHTNIKEGWDLIIQLAAQTFVDQLNALNSKAQDREIENSAIEIIKTEANKKIIELDKKQMVYQIGLLFYQRLTKKSPYPMPNSNMIISFPNTTPENVKQAEMDLTKCLKGYSDLKLSDQDQNHLTQLIMNMIDPNPINRKSFNEVLKELESMIAKVDPKLAEIIKSKNLEESSLKVEENSLSS